MKRLILSAIVLCLCASGFAVTTNYWADQQSSDFKAGKTKNVMISNLGKLLLGNEETKLLSDRPDSGLVFDMKSLSDGTVLAATGSKGQVLIDRGGKWEVFYTSDQPYIFSLAVDKKDKVYIGTGGSKGKIISVDKAGKGEKTIFSDDNVSYIWSIAVMDDGSLLAATGPNGKLYKIEKDSAKPIFSCKQNNLQSLAVDKDGAIYVGTDKDGIVYKIEKKKDIYVSRAIFDSNEQEISAIVPDGEGNLYVATASGKTQPTDSGSYLSRPMGTPQTKPTTKPAKPSKPTKSAKPSKPAPVAKKAPAPSEDKSKIPSIEELEKQLDDLPEPPGPEAKLPPGPPSMAMPPMPMMGGAGGKGNAVYKIDTLGFVRDVFRDQVDIHAMILRGDVIYLATGPDGWIYTLNPSTEEVTLFGKTESGHVNCLLETKGNQLLAGTGTPGQIIRYGSKSAKTGTFTSKVFDASQICRWGRIEVQTTELNYPSEGVSIQTRSSMLADAEDPGWSAWSESFPATKSVFIPSPAARYFQYRITFTGNGIDVPVIGKVQIAYMQDNRAPQIASLVVNTPDGMNKPSGNPGGGDGPPDPSGDTPPMPMGPPSMKAPGAVKNYQITWRATDPNGDQLRYKVYLRNVLTPYWVELEKDFAMANYQWDCRTVPDGKYEIKVIASDATSNPVGMGLEDTRISEPFLVDNTPPTIKNLSVKLTSHQELFIQADLDDEMSEISGAWITINAQKEWRYLAPVDEVYDSPSERIAAVLPITLTNQPVMVSMKVSDRAGNVGYAWKLIESPLSSEKSLSSPADEKVGNKK